MLPITNTKLKYIAYCRKSSEDEDRQILSIEAQIRELKEYADKNNLQIIEILTESKSAHKPGREVFDDLIAKIEAGKANAILVWHANRIARNSLDGGKAIWLIDSGKVVQIDTPSKQYRNTPDDKFYLSLEFTMAKKSSDDLSQVVKRGIRQKYERGEYPNLAPIGYINAKTNGVINIYHDPARAHLILRLFTEYATGKYSLGQTTQQVFDWGLRTRKGLPVSKSHLHRVLQNPVYCGLFEHGGELHAGSYEAIITKKLFDAVQVVLKNRGKQKKINNEWAYADILKCGCSCGANIIFETKKKYYKKTDRWAEYTYARSSKRCGKCGQKGITLDELERQMDEKLMDVAIDEDTWRMGIKLLNKKYEAEAKRRAQLVESQQRQHQTLQTELDGFFKMRAREEMTGEEFAAKKKNILEEQARLKEKINEGIEGQRTWLELAEDFLTTAFQAREMLNSNRLDLKRIAVRKVGWNLLLMNEKIVWTYRKPYDVLLKPRYRSDLRGRRNRENWYSFSHSPLGW